MLNPLLESGDAPRSTGVEREVTLLFADIRGFTRLSEGLKARDVVVLLNEVFQLVSDVILERGGTIDKFIGDSVMAYFGAPDPAADHALRAVTRAVEIQRAIERRATAQLRGRREHAGRARHRHPHRHGGGRQHRLGPPHRLHRDRRRGERRAPAREAREAGRDPGVGGGAAPRARRLRLRFEGERQLSGREEPVHVYAVEVPDA